MKLFSVCEQCDEIKPYDGNRTFGDLDLCDGCKEPMNVWTESGVRNENWRRQAAGLPTWRQMRTDT